MYLKTISEEMMYNVLFVNTIKEKCGVHQYGLTVFNLLRESKNFKCEYITPETIEQFLDRLTFKKNIEKSKYDIIIVNFHPVTTTKIFDPTISLNTGAKNICIFHDFYKSIIDKINNNKFYDRFMIGDSTIKNTDKVFGYGRILFNFDKKYQQNKVLKVGSFGFNGFHKNYYEIVERVQNEFDEAEININVPPNNATSDETIEDVKNHPNIKRIFASIRKPNIKVNVTHDFLTNDETINFLAKNDINMFLLGYLDWNSGSGIASSLDLALSTDKPLAISKSVMFRHVLQYGLPITVEDYRIKDILLMGKEVLNPIYKDWSRTNVLSQLESIILGA